MHLKQKMYRVERQLDRVRHGGGIFHFLAYSASWHNCCVWARQKPGTGIPSRSPTCVAGIEGYHPLPAKHIKQEAGSQSTWGWNWSSLWNIGILSDGSTHCTMVPPPIYFFFCMKTVHLVVAVIPLSPSVYACKRTMSLSPIFLCKVALEVLCYDLTFLK